MSVIRPSRQGGRNAQGGFTLIEVMIAVLITGLGLLGFAMLQTMNVRYTKSAQDRTKATSLAYELIDMMRSQRAQASYYNTVTYSSFTSLTANNGVCEFPSNAAAAASPTSSLVRWRCQLRNALPDGDAQVILQADGNVTVSIRWSDAYWNASASKTTFDVVSRI